jgi:hypothetical protein
VAINFGKVLEEIKNKKPARLWWGFWINIANFGAWLVGCNYRLRVTNNVVSQPNPNLVDAAIAKPLDQSLTNDTVFGIGDINGISEARVGDPVKKSGRTTGVTQGVVEGVDGTITVGFGGTRFAEFTDQIIIRGNNFSAPGDSGSVILSAENDAAVGLLFAGGQGITIANRFVHVQNLLCITRS